MPTCELEVLRELHTIERVADIGLGVIVAYVRLYAEHKGQILPAVVVGSAVGYRVVL